MVAFYNLCYYKIKFVYVQIVDIIYLSTKYITWLFLQDLAVRNVKGKEDFPLTLSWLSGQPPEGRLDNEDDRTTNIGQNSTASTDVPTFTAPPKVTIYTTPIVIFMSPPSTFQFALVRPCDKLEKGTISFVIFFV